jgi:hypothetical protein
MNVQDIIHLVDYQETRRRATYGSDQWTCDMQRKRFSLRRLGCDDMQCTPLLDCISDYGPFFSFCPSLVEASNLSLLSRGPSFMLCRRGYTLFSSHIRPFHTIQLTHVLGNGGDRTDGHTGFGR